MQRNFLWIFWTKRHQMGERSTWGCPKGGGITHQGAPGPPGTPRWAVPTSVASRTASLLYKYLLAPEALGESMKINSSHRKFQNHQIQSRHHHRGVHHPHWCLSDDA